MRIGIEKKKWDQNCGPIIKREEKKIQFSLIFKVKKLTQNKLYIRCQSVIFIFKILYMIKISNFSFFFVMPKIMIFEQCKN